MIHLSVLISSLIKCGQRYPNIIWKLYFISKHVWGTQNIAWLQAFDKYPCVYIYICVCVYIYIHMKWSEVKSLSRVWLFATLWTVAHQAPLSMGFSRHGYWSGLPFPSPGDRPNPGIEPRSPTLQADTLTSEPPGKPIYIYIYIKTWHCLETQYSHLLN